ncbi:MAG: N(2)-fixation sustaining protein CowN [Spirulinaceae cyanobacterium RM2_2_10]|nr:N(2)-fixation sustaining protein CowN [Spirulinaceae cyanobacterium SM2_1_0]NJO20831.1 N(2)-fixation sustaining protein CowN [Spirulinaceae cyanobacterium RM2_2_10]
MTSSGADRYVSFQGIDCEGDACTILKRVRAYASERARASAWADYLAARLAQQVALGQDDLFFVCSQVNPIRALLQERGDRQALDLLEHIEEDCC